MKKPGIPNIPNAGENRERFDRALKENVETLTGARGVRINKLPADAGIEDVIAKVNEILTLLQ
jgi:hypothetical protein